MNLTINRKNESEFYCEITDELDAITGTKIDGILAEENCIAIPLHN